MTGWPVEVNWSDHLASQKRGKPFEVSIVRFCHVARSGPLSCDNQTCDGQDQQIVDFLNPGQVPVIAACQPIYAVAKQVQ